jgi:tRNA(Ile)-lysidine synthase
MFQAFHDSLVKSGLLKSGDRVLVALSGGPDSVALLHLLHAASDCLGIELRAAHLDHALRKESFEDARFVADLCSSLNIPLVVERCDIAAMARRKRQGLEEAGREQRREFLSRVAHRQGCSFIALGHHRGDQAETVLHRLLRGTGLSGLAAMRLRSGPFIRPLLPFSRDQILDFLVQRQLDYREDSSNRERCFTRNRIRLDLMPLLKKFNPRVEERLTTLSRQIALEEDYWQNEVKKALDRVRCGKRPPGATEDPDNSEIWLDRAALLALHPALQIRVLRHALAEVRGGLAGLSAAHLEAVDQLVRTGPSQGELHLPESWVARRYERLWVRSTPPPEPIATQLTVDGPGEHVLGDGRRLRFLLLESPRGESSQAVEFAVEQVFFPLIVRTFRPGDRFRPDGGGGSGKLKKFFIDWKVDREIRQTVPLVVGREVLWVVGMRRCAGFQAFTTPAGVLRIEILPAD